MQLIDFSLTGDIEEQFSEADLFLVVPAENEWAFDLLYCVAFVVMDKQWLDRNATYMEFNVRVSSFIWLQHCNWKLFIFLEKI